MEESQDFRDTKLLKVYPFTIHIRIIEVRTIDICCRLLVASLHDID
jgi:hypothetical protein